MYDIPPVDVPIVPYRPLVVILTNLQFWKPQITATISEIHLRN